MTQRGWATLFLLALTVMGCGASVASTTRDAPVGLLGRDRWISTEPGVRIHVIDAGADRGQPPLVLIPGWRLTATIWEHQIQAFSRGRRVIAVDPRSQGASTVTGEGNTPEHRARDLQTVLSTLGLHAIVLVGWSQGVQDVAAYVDQFGTAALKAIVLVDAAVATGAPEIERSPRRVVQSLMRFPRYSEQPQAYTRGMMEAIITRPLPAARMQQLIDDALRTPTAIAQAMLIADLFTTDRTPALAKIDRPALVIASSASRELDAQKAMANRLACGAIEVIDGAGHAVFVDQPERFDEVLSAFLRRLDEPCAAATAEHGSL